MGGPPPFFRSFGTMPLIDSAIQIGRGAAAAVLGQTYDVYRLGASTGGSVVTGVPQFTAYPARVRRSTMKVAIENAFFDALIYESTSDNRALVLQDVLVQTGYENDDSIFTFAQARPTRETIFVRTESAVTITRPIPPAGAAAQQPLAGPVATLGWGGIDKTNEQVLTLVNGLYAFDGLTATPAVVYCGLQPLNRIKDTSTSTPAGKMPTALYREHFVIYIPDLPGIMLNELDRINFPNSDRYEVALYHTSNQTGLTGYICVCEKLST